MRKLLLHLKDLFIVLCMIILAIFKDNWKPLLKLLIISGLLWIIGAFIPHNIPMINQLTYLSWVCIILIVKLLFIKYDDFSKKSDDEDNNEIVQIQDDDGKEIINDSTFGSTRE